MKVTKFENFEWIDFTKPDHAELKEFSKSHNLDQNLLYDSLQHGHLPKLKKIKDYTFIILRAFSAEQNEKVASIVNYQIKLLFS